MSIETNTKTIAGAEVRNLDVPPTIKIPAGYKFSVRVNRDILREEPYYQLQQLGEVADRGSRNE